MKKVGQAQRHNMRGCILFSRVPSLHHFLALLCSINHYSSIFLALYPAGVLSTRCPHQLMILTATIVAQPSKPSGHRGAELPGFFAFRFWHHLPLCKIQRALKTMNVMIISRINGGMLYCQFSFIDQTHYNVIDGWRSRGDMMIASL